MNTEIFEDWVMLNSTTPDQVLQARAIMDFLDWACRWESQNNNNSNISVRESGYSFSRKVSIPEHSGLDLPEDVALVKLVTYFLDQNK